MKTPKTWLPCIAGLLVLIIGAYIVWSLIQFCAQHFPSPDPDPAPEPSLSNVVSSASYFTAPAATAKAVEPSPVVAPCYNYVAFTILPADGGVFLSDCRLPGLESRTGFYSDLASLGLNPNTTTTAPGIAWDGAQLTVGSGAVRIVIEESFDLASWMPIATNNVPEGVSIACTLPVPCGSNCFWRAVR